MRKFAFTTAILLVGCGLAGAEEFTGLITKVDGDKVYVTRFGPPAKKDEKPREPEILTAADSCKVFQLGKFNPATKMTDADQPVEDGLKSKLFVKATVTARIVILGEKVAKVTILTVEPDNEFRAVVKKVDGQKVTFSKMGGAGLVSKKETTLTAVDDVKVVEMKMDKETKKRNPVPLTGGLKHELFQKDVTVLLILDDDQKIVEIRVNPAGIVRPAPPK
jgi:hypothetical protein